MAHCTPSFKSKAALKRAIKAGEHVTVFQEGPWGGPIVNGNAVLEMPPEYHRWYAQVTIDGGRITSVK